MKFRVNLVKLPNKILRTKSKEVSLPLSEEDDLLAQKMIWHVDTSQNDENLGFQPAVGVAAIQYGIAKRMFYINGGNYPKNSSVPNSILRDVLINPVILATSDSLIALEDGEGCLSVGEKWKNQEGFVYRKSRIKAKAYSYMQKKEIELDLTGYLAVVFQHEYDHLEGKLFVDHIINDDPWKVKSNARFIDVEEA
ncbi:Peptide deformylase [Mycoplasmopsis meleagridis]|uniref:Peptide deformylase n=1 Tax=Mycoplasmopsis meleagridis ATCC 25294 TaxID=1264554 RepID=A0A0F5H121_9BACT|nr:peptide deformylase [Mycoplasmopsis meleagridis]KKB26903.1 Peptide deformylase [Mycoplasmopsis meleagridis ATCC 25294]KUH47320.1 peptide deformylase [Mycoplasmopsis meleagridis]OAD18267.1 Peptide deformylase [Mycoplasmopsis meleagridis]VEU77559.1 peptide deformylase [Mycoplasmopsis meleagridis]